MCIIYFIYTFCHIVHHRYHLLHDKMYKQSLISEANATEWASLKWFRGKWISKSQYDINDILH